MLGKLVRHLRPDLREEQRGGFVCEARWCDSIVHVAMIAFPVRFHAGAPVGIKASARR